MREDDDPIYLRRLPRASVLEADQWTPPGGQRTEGMTLDEVAAEFGVSRERIRQIEARALRQLRHPSRSKILAEFVR